MDLGPQDVEQSLYFWEVPGLIPGIHVPMTKKLIIEAHMPLNACQIKEDSSTHKTNWHVAKNNHYDKLDFMMLIIFLQPIRSQFSFFGDYSPGCEKPRKEDAAKWNKTFEELQSLIRKAAVQADGKGELTKLDIQLSKYFTSGTCTPKIYS